MKRTNVLFLVAAVVVGAGFGVAIRRDARRRAAAEEKTASAEATITTLRARLDRARRSQHRPGPRVATSAGGPKRIVSPADRAKALDEQLSRAAAKWEKEYEAQEKDPRVQLARLAGDRARLQFEYGRLYRQLGLSASQIAEFETNILRVREKMSDVATAVLEAGLSFDDPEVRSRFFTPINAEFRQSQKQLLGEAGFQQFSDYESMRSARDKVGTFAGFALVSDNSLTPEQLDRLSSAIADSSQKQPPNASGGSGLDWDAIDRKASTILTPSQFELWRNYEPPSGGRRWSRFNAALTQARKSDPVVSQSTPAHP